MIARTFARTLLCLTAVICGTTSLAIAAARTGTGGDDTIIATMSADRIVALGGDDRVFALAGDDRIAAGAGDDTVYGDATCGAGGAGYCDTGQTEDDGDDDIAGNGGDDVLVGGGGADRILGGHGDDSIYARDGVRDAIRCGPGRDRVSADEVDSAAADCESVSRR